MQQLLLATANEGKIVEIREGLQGLDVRFLTLNDVEVPDAPEERGTTFEKNALEKAEFYFERTGIPSLADDSGIHVETLRDELGIRTRRWGAGPLVSDEEWIRFFLERMKREKNKRAEFVCVLALADGNRVRTFRGVCKGVITDELQADYLPGLPISACFIPDGCDRVFSALSVEEKNRVSHRGKAIWKVRRFLSSVV